MDFTKSLENLQIEALNAMQLAAIELTNTGKDMVLLSPTGSGKTLAFLLPILSKLDPKAEGVQALIIAPSRELAIQIEKVFKTMSTGFKVNCCYGGHETKIERNNLSQPPALLIGTPGRIKYHLKKGSFETGNIHFLVMDEFDKSLEFGFQEDMSFIVGQLHNVKQRILISATKSIDIPDFTGLKNYKELDFLSKQASKNLEIKKVVAEGTDKLEALFKLVCYLGEKPTLVFCNHRDAVDRISEILLRQDIHHGVFHGGMEQEDRERTLIKLRNGTFRMLIATDLAARGLDIPEIACVVHYQMPLTQDAYIHRNGRTARMHAEGTAYLVLGEEEQLPDYIAKSIPTIDVSPYEDAPINTQWVTIYIGGGKKDKINKIDIVGLLLQKGGLLKEELGLIEVLDHSAFAAVKAEKAKKLVQLIKSEKLKKKDVKIDIAR